MRSSPARSWIGRRSSGPTRRPASSCAMRCTWEPVREHPLCDRRPAAAGLHPRARALPRGQDRRACARRGSRSASAPHSSRAHTATPSTASRRFRSGATCASWAWRVRGPAISPRSARPSRRRSARRPADRPDRLGPAYRRLTAALNAGEDASLKPLADELQAALEADSDLIDPERLAWCRRETTRVRDDVDPNCYWRADVWRRIVVIARGARSPTCSPRS